MADDLRILITADLNRTGSEKTINEAIKEIEKNISSLTLNIQIPDNIQKALQDFVNLAEKLKTSTTEQNKVVREEIKVFENLDGTIKKVIQKHLENGEIQTKIIEKHKETSEAIQQEKKSLEELLGEYSKYQLKSEQTKYNKAGNITGTTRVYSDGNQLLRVELDAHDQLVKYIITDRKETEKLRNKKAELRTEVQKLAQVGTLSSTQLAKVAKEVNSAFDDAGIKRAQKALKDAQKSSAERLKFIQLENKVSADQAKLMAKWEKDIDRAHYLAFKEKQKREEHLHKLVLDRVEAERLAYIEEEKRRKSSAGLRLDGAVRLGTFDSLKKSTITYEDVKNALALSDAYKELEIREVKLNQVTGQWTATIRKSASENLALKGVIDKTTGSIYEQEKALKQASAKNLGVFQQLSIALQRVPVWMGAMTAFYAPLRGLRNATRQILEIDKQMTALMRVSNGEIDRIEILKESIDLADRLGNRIIDINEGIENFARQGFRGQGLIAMTEAATLFSNISDMNVEEASSGLTAIIKGFQMLPEEVMRAVDAINEVNVISLLSIAI